MAYIWVNPVTDGMYEPEVLNEFLRRHGYKRLHTSGDWLAIVKEKYGQAVKQAKAPVMDMRCPKIRELLDDLQISSNVVIPDIKPILIHCAKEGSEQEALLEEEKLITTPCQALADMGNALGLKNTVFISWNRFVASLDEEPERIVQKKSPIPPGFFTELGLKTVSITGEKEIREYFKDGVPDNVQLVEMLFCKDGCHNGDGIVLPSNDIDRSCSGTCKTHDMRMCE